MMNRRTLCLRDEDTEHAKTLVGPYTVHSGGGITMDSGHDLYLLVVNIVDVIACCS